MTDQTATSEPMDQGPEPRATEPSGACPAPFCQGKAGHRGLHDIRSCRPSCGPIVGGWHRAWHGEDCPNRNHPHAAQKGGGERG